MDCSPDDQLRADVRALLINDPARRVNLEDEVDRVIQIVCERVPARALVAAEFPRLRHVDFAKIMHLRESELRRLLGHRLDRLPAAIIAWLERCGALIPFGVRAAVDTERTVMNRSAEGVTEDDGRRWLTTVAAGVAYAAGNGAFGEITAARAPAEVPEDVQLLLRDSFGAAQNVQATLSSRRGEPPPVLADMLTARRPTSRGRHRAYGDDRDLMLDVFRSTCGPFVARCFVGRGENVNVPRHIRLDVSPTITDKYGRTIYPRGRMCIDDDILPLLQERMHPEIERDVYEVECLDPDDSLLVFKQCVRIHKGRDEVSVGLCLFEGADMRTVWAVTNMQPSQEDPRIEQSLAAAMHALASHDAVDPATACRERDAVFRSMLELDFDDPVQHARYLGLVESAYALVAMDRVHGTSANLPRE